ncbi:MAG: hypothetical protein A2Y33_15200 [Spirochaetes bacterium GWF1_51_8]|nr:MAG: hypothetical protein A2Y33_15200 [Spirochaetes bacterium GWF1_51_8]
MDFQLKKETFKPEYSADKGKSRKHAFAAVCIMLGVAIAAGTNSASAGGGPLGGDIAYFPEITNVGEVKIIVDSEFKKHLPINFSTDMKISLKTGQGSIEFTADLYDKTSGIAFEWTGAKEYGKNLKNSEILSKDEIKLIKDYQFSSNYIVVLSTIYEYDLTEQVKTFIEFYMKQ